MYSSSGQFYEELDKLELLKFFVLRGRCTCTVLIQLNAQLFGFGVYCVSYRQINHSFLTAIEIRELEVLCYNHLVTIERFHKIFSRFKTSYTGLLPIPVVARSQVWDCGLLPAGIPGSNLAGGMMYVTCDYWVLSGRGLCDRAITNPEESY